MKRAIRALESDDYKKAYKKPNSRLPPVNDKAEALAALKQLPLHRLAFQVNKIDTDDAIKGGLKPKAGVPCLQISPNQQFEDDMYFCWFYEPVSIMTYLYAVGALVVIFAVVLFPLWPLAMRKGVWYLSMAFLGLIAAFFGIALIRLVLFCATYLVLKPGLWIFPNLFEDVGVIESFIPFWAWSGEDSMKIHRPKKRISKKKKAAKLEKKLKQEAEAKGQAQKSTKTKELESKLENVNKKMRAIAEERAKQGRPLQPPEVQMIGQQLLAQELGPDFQAQLQAAAAAAASEKNSHNHSHDDGHSHSHGDGHSHSHDAPVSRIVQLEDEEEE